MARLITRDPELARDAVQESLLAAWRDLPGLRDPERFDAWTHRLTARACVALARRQRRRPEVELGEIDPPVAGDMAAAVAERELLDRALRALDPERRALLVMHIYAGIPLPEVATSLDLPLGTAKSRLSRTLASLRVAGFGEEPDMPLRGTPAEGRTA
jgi:RNA polymerase sigma-70 factor (ECF subfamily)